MILIPPSPPLFHLLLLSECQPLLLCADPSNGNILPFQSLQKRARKDVSASEIKISVAVYAFDMLFSNGVSLLKKPLRERRKELMERFKYRIEEQISTDFIFFFSFSFL